MRSLEIFCRGTFLAAMVATCFSFTGSQSTRAGNLPPVAVVNEVMMEVQGAEAAYIGRTFGPDTSSPLSFTSNVDVAAQTFSFSLNGGSTYQGNSISLSGSGALDSSTGLFDWSTTGFLGSSPLDGSGTINPDPGIGGRWPPDGPIYVDWHGQGSIGIDSQGHVTSSWSYQFTINDLIVSQGQGKDNLNLGIMIGNNWNWVLDPVQVGDESFAIDTTGFTPPTGGSGAFTVTISSVPEPSTITLGCISMIGLTMVCRWRRNHAGR
jgi:hypothetical protein